MYAGGRGRWRAGEGRGWGDGLPSHLNASRDRVYRCTEPLGVCRCQSAGLTGVVLRLTERPWVRWFGVARESGVVRGGFLV